jgi:hypothetical protein
VGEVTLENLAKEFGDWHSVFECAMRDELLGVDGFAGSLAPFAVEDVEHVVATAEGEGDGESWVGIFRLRDGRYAYVTAWCDYTGWG